MAYGLSNGYVTDVVTVTWHRGCCKALRSAILATAWLLVSVLLARDSILHNMLRALFHRQSVCLSVCLSRVDQSKWLKLGLWNFNHTVTPSLFCGVSFTPELHAHALSIGTEIDDLEWPWTAIMFELSGKFAWFRRYSLDGAWRVLKSKIYRVIFRVSLRKQESSASC